jgi:hypothetical protein
MDSGSGGRVGNDIGSSGGGGGCGHGQCSLWSPCPPKMSTIKLIILSKKEIVLRRTIIIREEAVAKQLLMVNLS